MPFTPDFGWAAGRLAVQSGQQRAAIPDQQSETRTGMSSSRTAGPDVTVSPDANLVWQSRFAARRVQVWADSPVTIGERC